MPRSATTALSRVLLPIAATALLAGTGHAQPANPAGKIDPAVGATLNDAIAALRRGEHEAARAAIAALPEGASPYARSRAEQVLFNVAFEQKRYEDARGHIARAIAAGGLQPQEIRRLRYQDAQILLTEKRWPEGARALEAWLETAEYVPPSAYHLLAVAHYQANESAAALRYAHLAVDGMEEPRESWLALLASLHLRERQYRDAVPVLNRLVALLPEKKTYLLQLSSVYGNLGDLSSAAAVAQIAYDGGLLTEDSELRRFVELLIHTGSPQRARAVVEETKGTHAGAYDAALYEQLTASDLGD